MKALLLIGCSVILGASTLASDVPAREDLTKFSGVWKFVKNDALPKEGKRLSEWAASHLTVITRRTIPAIYSIDGGMMKLFALATGKDWPKAFPRDSAGGVITLRRSEALSGSENGPRENVFLEKRARAAAEDLSSTDEERRLLAAAELLRLGVRAAPALPELLALLRTERNDLPIALIIGQLGEPAVKPLIAILQEGPKADRASALCALAWIGPPAKAAVPIVRELLDSDKVDVAVLAAYALARIDPERRQEAIEFLQRTLSTKNAGTDFVPLMLAWLHPDDPGPALPVLAQSLRSQSCMFGDLMRLMGAYGMAVLGPAAHPAAAPLREALDDPEPVVQVLSAYALAQASPKDRDRALAVLARISANRSDPTAPSLEQRWGTQGQPTKAAYNTMMVATLDVLLTREPGNQFPTDHLLRWAKRGLQQAHEQRQEWLKGDPLAAGLAREMVWRLDPASAKKLGIRTLDR